MNTYNPINVPSSGNGVFWWFHKYIDTRLSRQANSHSTIKYPVKVAKEQMPYKENKMPEIICDSQRPDLIYDKYETAMLLHSNVSNLPDPQKEIVSMYYGLNGGDSVSIDKISKTKNIPVSKCVNLINKAQVVLK
jgi:DNA-directed RNA polymerase specialized sigma subunit